MTDYSHETYESLHKIWFEGDEVGSLSEKAKAELMEDFEVNPLKETNFNGFVKRGLKNEWLNRVNR